MIDLRLSQYNEGYSHSRAIAGHQGAVNLSTNGHECSLILFFCSCTISAHFDPFRSWHGRRNGAVRTAARPSLLRELDSWSTEIAVPAQAGTAGFATTRQGRPGGEVRGQLYYPEIMVDKGKAGWQGASVRANALQSPFYYRIFCERGKPKCQRPMFLSARELRIPPKLKSDSPDSHSCRPTAPYSVAFRL